MNKKWYFILFLLLIMILAGISIRFFSKSNITLKAVSFEHLPNWKTTATQPSLRAFKLSCKTFLKQDPEREVGNKHISLKIKDWQPACREAMSIAEPISEDTARVFFQTWFSPVAFYQHRPIQGLFTGYFLPVLKASLTKTKEYTVPLYGLPSNLITVNLGLFNPELKNKHLVGRLEKNKLLPFYTRKQINQGAIDKTAPILLWINSPMDRIFLEIEGSGVVELGNGQLRYIGYAGENGAEYKSIASIMIKKGILTHDTASSQQIKTYLNAHPSEIDEILNKNKSFVFFRYLDNKAAIGAQGVPLTPGYSLAIDPNWIPYGTPAWLSTTIPTDKEHLTSPFNRLMIAQDTGGAIRGVVRGDVFWGAEKKSAFTANHMHDQGQYWLLLPKKVVERQMVNRP